MINRILLAIAVILVSSNAYAVPWCHRGIVKVVSTVAWTGSQTTNHAASIQAPQNHPNPAWYKAYTASDNYCSSFSGGGGGGSLFPSVPGSGQVKTVPLGPNSFVVSPASYQLSHGLNFRCDKCYTMLEAHILRPGKPHGFPGVHALPLKR